MATLTATERAELRRDVAAASDTVTWNKDTVNAALQGIEDWFEANRASLGAAIETAAPGAFDSTHKRRLVKQWLRQKFERGG